MNGACYVPILLYQFGEEIYSFSIKKSFPNVLADRVTFQTTPSPGRAKDLFKNRTRFFPDERPLLETLEFFEISYDSYQPFNCLPYLSLSTQYSVLMIKVCLNLINDKYH